MTIVYQEATVWQVCGQIFIVGGNALSLFRLLLWPRFATIKISSAYQPYRQTRTIT